MSAVKKGETVTISYNAKLNDGTVFDNCPEGEPFRFTYGNQIVTAELEKAIMEMEVGETKTIVLPSANAYGDYDESLVIPIPKRSLPKNFDIKVGQNFVYSTEDNEIIRVKVSLEDDINIYFDHNHPLAGKTLEYEVTLLEIAANQQ